MAFARVAAPLLLAGLVPAAGTAQTADAFVETFHEACLAQLPDFAGSPAAFESLGFAGSDRNFVRDGEGQRMQAEIYERTVDGGRGCVIAAEVAGDAPVLSAVEALVADLSGNDFRRRDAERGGKRIDAFIWQQEAWEVLVVVLPPVSGMRALNVTVGEAAR